MKSANRKKYNFGQLYEPTKLGFAVYDADYRLEACNDAFLTILDSGPALFCKGSNLLNLIDDLQQRLIPTPSKQQGVHHFRKKMAKRSSFWDEFLTPDGRRFCLHTHPTPDKGWASVCHEVQDDIADSEFLGYLVRQDPVTGCVNRIVFQAYLDQALRNANRSESIAVLVIALDHVRELGVRHGPDEHDELLNAAATRIRKIVCAHSQLAYLYGNQFAVLLPVNVKAVGIERIVRAIREEIALPFEIGGREIRLTSYMGIAMSPRDTCESGTLMQRASLALDRAIHESDHGGYAFYCKHHAEQVRRRNTLECEIKRSISQDAISVNYQPIIDADTGNILSFEALLAWPSCKNGEVSPLEVAEIAEESGQGHALGSLILRHACIAASEWQDDISVAVNISSAQFVRKDLSAEIDDALRVSGLPAHRLMLEISETAVGDKEAAIETLHKLRDLGVKITLDDFGIGNASLHHIQSFAYDAIKLSRIFVHNLGIDQRRVAVVRAIAALTRMLGVPLIAEGVETECQKEVLSALGCSQLQGYWYGRTLPSFQKRNSIGNTMH